MCEVCLGFLLILLFITLSTLCLALSLVLYYRFFELLKHISWSLSSFSQNGKRKTQFSNENRWRNQSTQTVYSKLFYCCWKPNTAFRSHTRPINTWTLLRSHYTGRQKMKKNTSQNCSWHVGKRALWIWSFACGVAKLETCCIRL